MRNPTGYYLYSDATLTAAENYLASLRKKLIKTGPYLRAQLAQIDIQEIDAKELIVLLMNTRRSKIYAKSPTILNGDNWNAEATFILGDVSFMTTGTHSYNNGAWKRHVNHTDPIETNFIFVAAALLQNSSGQDTADMTEVLFEGQINEGAFYRLYERRLLPGLLMQNQHAKDDGMRLVINIPAIGCQQLAGKYESQVRELFPRVIKQLFINHASSLDSVDTVNFDPYQKPIRDDFSINTIPGTNIRLMQRPSLGLFEGQTGKIASQLEFPKDGKNYTAGFRLLKIVESDRFSYPGNDIWNNYTVEGCSGRAKDAGVAVASSDVILALSNMGQFGQGCAIRDVHYISSTGMVYAKNPREDGLLSYFVLNQTYPATFSRDMLNMVKLPQVVFSPKDRNAKCDQGFSSFFARPVVKSGACTLLSAVGVVVMATALICSLTPMSMALIGLVIAAICMSASAYALYNDFFLNHNKVSRDA
ncbi:MAG: hypothetical protein EBY16_04760 [Gammaproteobacteria bacterium]|nr:hypothetical protein [Gammaproteobacteria bacterium]